MNQRDTVVWAAIRKSFDAVGSMDTDIPAADRGEPDPDVLADCVDDALKTIDPHALAQHLRLPVALSGAPEFDKAVSALVTPCLLMMAQGHIENGRRQARGDILVQLKGWGSRVPFINDLADWIDDCNKAMMPPIDGASMIAVERLRQIYAEGHQAQHDDEYTEEQLRIAALCYADLKGEFRDSGNNDYWPWRPDSDKRAEKTQLRRLVIAGALLAAEIDRRIRAGEKS